MENIKKRQISGAIKYSIWNSLGWINSRLVTARTKKKTVNLKKYGRNYTI